MRKLFILTLSLFLWFSLSAQSAIGSWNVHNAYHLATLTEESPEKVFAVSEGSLYSYDKKDQSLETYNKVTGLSDQEIAFLHFSTATDQLLIIYKNNNIDLLSSRGVVNLPALMEKSYTGDKNVYNIREHDGTAYLATGFGVVLVDLEKREIRDSYMLGMNCKAVCVHDGFLYVASDQTIRRGNIARNLSDLSQWEDFSPIGLICDMTSFDGRLTLVQRWNGIIMFEPDNVSWKYLVRNDRLERIKHTADDEVIAFAPLCTEAVRIQPNQVVGSIQFPEPICDLSKNEDANLLWAAGTESSLCAFRLDGNTAQMELSDLTPSGIIANNTFHLTLEHDKLFVSGGGKNSNRLGRPGQISILENGFWHNVDRQEVEEQSGRLFSDIVHVVSDPKAADHLFAFSWGEGIFEFRDGKCVGVYDSENSPIERISPSDPHSQRVDGGAFDRSGNLWFTNSNVNAPLKVRKADGSWATLSHEALTGHNNLGKVLITSRNQKWVNILFSKKAYGVFVLDDNGTLENTSDDKTAFISTVKYLDNGQVAEITPGAFKAVAEDLNGNIWIGTDKGPFVAANPSKVFNDNFYLNRIKVPRNDGTNLADYLLESENISAIAVDGGNRKWIGTADGGVYLISADGLETLLHFTKDNSPLPSNGIHSIVIHPQTGDVYIATEKGLVSYRSDAISGKSDYSSVYAYPNPVRPDYHGTVTITGLMENSLVKITDVNNNLIYQANSIGGQLSWDAHNGNGERIASGVYLVYATSSDGKKGIATKILFIR